MSIFNAVIENMHDAMAIELRICRIYGVPTQRHVDAGIYPEILSLLLKGLYIIFLMWPKVLTNQLNNAWYKNKLNECCVYEDCLLVEIKLVRTFFITATHPFEKHVYLVLSRCLIF